MTKKITISVPDELHEKMGKWRKSFNFSQIFKEAVTREIAKKELFHLKLAEDKTLKEIMQTASLETPEETYQTGKEMGFAYARTSPYYEIKRYEEYIEGWKNKDEEIIEKIYYDLDIMSILDRAGLVGNPEDFPEDTSKLPLGSSFEYGFMDGVMEFIQGECSSVEIGKVVLERDKILAVVKNEDDRLRVIEM